MHQLAAQIERLGHWAARIRMAAKALFYQPVVAAAILWRRVALRRCTVVAITGSVGKSTAADCLESILSQLGPTIRNHGSNGRYGLPATILRARPRHRFVVLEAGILKPGRMWRSAFLIRPHVAVITAVNWQHSKNFDSLERIAAEKAKLLDGLPPGGLAILNRDDPRVAGMGAGRDCRVVTYGLDAGADVRGRVDAAVWPDRLALTARDAEGAQRIPTQLVGAHWATSVLAALAAARSLGASWQTCAEALERTPPHTARLEPVTLPSGAILLRDEYNGSWASLDKAVRVLADASAERKIVALGHLVDGPEPGGEHIEQAARAVARTADMLLAWGAYAERYATAAREQRREMPVEICDTQTDLAKSIRRVARRGDLILLKGYWYDHMSRIVYQQFGEVGCSRPYCTIPTVCDPCPKLRFEPAPECDRAAMAQLQAGPARSARAR